MQDNSNETRKQLGEVEERMKEKRHAKFLFTHKVKTIDIISFLAVANWGKIVYM